MPGKVDHGKCVGCEACLDSCPAGAIEMQGDKAIITDSCVDCGACVDECPVEAISVD